jgi:hypothetical protein
MTGECVVCFEPITPEQPSFVVLGGRCHEGRCRSEYNGMMMDEECGPAPLPEPHFAEWPDTYKPWMH